MSCERDEALNAWVDGQLGAEARVELEAHLANCAGCRAKRDALDALRRELEGAFTPESRFATSLAERVARGYERPARSRAWGFAAAAAVALAVLSLLVFRREPPPKIVRVPVPDPREAQAWRALEGVHAWGHQNPTDPAGFSLRCSEMAKAWPDTEASKAAQRAAAAFGHRCMSPNENPALEELRRVIAAGLDASRAREAVDAALAALDRELNAPLARENFGEARRLLQAARSRRAEPRWTSEVERRSELLEARVAELSTACVAGAQADPSSARAWRDRVAAWGVEESLARFDRDVKIEEKKEPPPPPPAPEAKGLLCLAVTGDLLVKGPAPRKGQRVAPPLFIATRQDALCAFETEGGDILRVNALTRLEIGAKGALLLDEGELFVVAKGAVEIQSGGRTIRAKGATFEVSHRDAGRMVKGPARSRLRVLALRGEVKVDERVVKEGELCAASNGVFEPGGPAEDVVLATRWTHALLRERPEDAAELRARADHLAMALDDARHGKEAEAALRSMGDDAAGALLGLLNQGKMAREDLRRFATLAADLAGPRRVPEMIDKLELADAAVRAELARGLRRITGQTFGPTRSLWEGWAEKSWK